MVAGGFGHADTQRADFQGSCPSLHTTSVRSAGLHGRDADQPPTSLRLSSASAAATISVREWTPSLRMTFLRCV